MEEILFLFKDEEKAREFEESLHSTGAKTRRTGTAVITAGLKDEEILYLLSEMDENTLKDLKVYQGEVGNDCENIVKAISKAEPVTNLIDKVIYHSLGNIFIDTKTLFHPIVDVKEKRVKAFEALCRPPIKIVDLINMGKSTSEFSENFCRYMALKNARKFLKEDMWLFLNFHPRFLREPLKVFGDFISTLYMHDVSPRQVVVELTEYEELEISAVKSLISFLKSEGVKIALDDVGSGYSGLFYLSELGPDIIKIDMELIRDIHKHSMKKVIVNYLIRLAHENNIKVVSEGVETLEELKTVLYMGTDFVQGFIFSKPLENPNLEELNEKIEKIISQSLT
ncbi:EAL domain-containing protein [Aquifex aeolicus]|uniref:EAL domain-containing protein n=1 Tax=Aquifex aeolicus (strain VF5) TaxID=224324 RepID=O66495_AQUAE|nr:EAL domain-containing protein [Aquifex aeolicus]AAC06454.1 hypothetical protein aq_083 [Aquifex aeolicus VF5]